MGIRCPWKFSVVQCSAVLVNSEPHLHSYNLRPRVNNNASNQNRIRSQRQKRPRPIVSFRKPTSGSQPASGHTQYLKGIFPTKPICVNGEWCILARIGWCLWWTYFIIGNSWRVSSHLLTFTDITIELFGLKSIFNWFTSRCTRDYVQREKFLFDVKVHYTALHNRKFKRVWEKNSFDSHMHNFML